MNRTLNRVVVTGLGTLNPLGNNLSESWPRLVEGQSGIDTLKTFDASQIASRIAGEIKNFNAKEYIDPKEIKKMDLFIQYSLAATQMALEDSGLISKGGKLESEVAGRSGCIVGAGLGGLPAIERYHNIYLKRGASKVSPFFIPSTIANLASGYIAIRFGTEYVNYSTVSACSSGTHAIGEALLHIQTGRADMMIAGGTESVICPMALSGFSSLKALSCRNEDPQKASRPWDKDRDGFVIAEAAGTLILENYEKAVHRGARIYAELSGYGASADAHHITQPSEGGSGLAKAIKGAIDDAQLNVEDIGYINAHGTSTPLGDLAESQAIKKVFGNHAKKVCVSSTKSMTGHTLGAAGAIESIFAIMSLKEGIIPPTINLENPDEDCDLDFVPLTAREKKLQHVLNSSSGFGGTNACLCFSQI